jgi:hypothetical protein
MMIFCFLHESVKNILSNPVIIPAVKYLKVVIPTEEVIQKNTGCRIKSGMTEFGYLDAGLIIQSKVKTLYPIVVTLGFKQKTVS